MQNAECRMQNVEWRTFNIQHSTFNILHSAFCILHSSSYEQTRHHQHRPPRKPIPKPDIRRDGRLSLEVGDDQAFLPHRDLLQDAARRVDECGDAGRAGAEEVSYQASFVIVTRTSAPCRTWARVIWGKTIS